ncbi:unnamed protein product [Linum tenue]|uniref:Protein downstream neighbor of Son n=1 Tax=Linum tenue TaxID=586396 RepID=A0AAV0J1G3_9ROSI|nr:unnamed protein product [Linum tenue]
MAKVAPPASLPPNSLQIGGGPLNVGPMAKRKTPSDLRREQLRRTSIAELMGESKLSMPGKTNNTGEAENGVKKPDVFRNPKYIHTRLDEVYPIKKSRLGILPVKEKVKEDKSTEQLDNLKNLPILTNLAPEKRETCSEKLVAHVDVSTDCSTKAHQTIEKCSQNIFRTVAELSTYGKQSSGLAVVDMDKALKGLAACEPASHSRLNTDTTGKSGHYSDNFCSECCIPGKKPPLDFTLKTKMRLLCACSVSGFHRSILSSTYRTTPQFIFQQGCAEESCGPLQTLNSQLCNPKSLHSWVYPQSTLPPAVISVLSSSAAEGDFLRKRQVAWADSFRSLYYLLRKNICSIFYVCTSHFVVMFTNGGGSGCSAYISQSTINLRSLLREHDVCFSMPLCHSKVEQVATEHLVELAAIRRENLGQVRNPSSLDNVDNTPESLLAFKENIHVQGLYDFLLNYRSSLTLLSGVDVPVLYSPIPFPNAALSAPEISCVDMKRADHAEASPKDGSSVTLSSIIEVKGTFIPPWIVSRICALMSCEATNFEASFATEPTSIGLNVAIKNFDEKSNSVAETVQESGSSALGLSEAIVAPCLSSGFLTGLKYRDNSYIASLSPA